MSNEVNNLPPIEVPIEALSAEALLGVIKEFILREGTDYGTYEVSFEKKMEQVQSQIEHGAVKIFFDPNSETITLIPRH